MGELELTDLGSDLLEQTRARLRDAVRALFAATEGCETDPDGLPLLLDRPKDASHGDLGLACFPLAKPLRMAPPQVASALVEHIDREPFLESVEPTGPFLNLRFRREALAETVVRGIATDAPPFGRSPAIDKCVVVDFSSPNIAKPFHLGHLRSTVIGAALRRLYRHAGWEVHGINHLGDWGAQFGKIMVAWRNWGDEEALREDPMRHLHAIYVRINQELKAGNKELEQASAEAFQKLEAGAAEERALWEKLRNVSLEAFERPYARLGVEFDHVAGESFYEDKVEATIDAIVGAGITTVSEGALVVELKDKAKVPPCILRKSDGTTIYATRDLAALFYRRENYRFDKALYVVGGEQKLHFQQLRLVLEKLGWQEAKGLEHINFGLILAWDEEKKKWGKMSSRKAIGGGDNEGTIFLDDLLDDAVAHIAKIIEEKNPDLANKGEVAEMVGVSAIVFNDLKNGRIKDVKFDWNEMMNFEGETGPYVQFAGARLAGILRKAGLEPDGDINVDIDFSQLADADQVLLTMLEFGPTLQRCIDKNEPSILTHLMVRVASSIHSYLRDHHVLSAEQPLRDARLSLVAASRKLLATGLGLLGVASPNEM